MGRAKLHISDGATLASFVKHLPDGVCITKSEPKLAFGVEHTVLSIEGDQVPDAEEVVAIVHTEWDEAVQASRISSVVFRAVR